jgi:hypothetical protein
VPGLEVLPEVRLEELMLRELKLRVPEVKLEELMPEMELGLEVKLEELELEVLPELVLVLVPELLLKLVLLLIVHSAMRRPRVPWFPCLLKAFQSRCFLMLVQLLPIRAFSCLSHHRRQVVHSGVSDPKHSGAYTI